MRDLMVNKTWTAERADVAVETPPEINALNEGFKKGQDNNANPVESAIMAIVEVHAIDNALEAPVGTVESTESTTTTDEGPTATKPQEPASAAPLPAPTEQPVAQTPPLTTPLPQESTPAASNPMGMFAKKDSNSAETAKEAALPPVPAEPRAAAQTPPPVAETPTPVEPPANIPDAPKTTAPPKAELPPEIRKIIEKAGKEHGKKIFKNENQDNE